MRPLSRRGFTLIELLVALALTALVTAALYQAIIGTQRVSRTQVQRMDVQQNTRAGASYLTAAIRELAASEGDLLIANPTTLRFRAMRWAGVVCTGITAAGGNVTMVVSNGLLYGARAPDPALDSLFLFRDGDTGTRGDDQWLMGGLEAMTPGALCTDGSAGTSLAVRIAPGSGGNDSALVGVTVGSPIRGYQLEEVSLYPDGNGVNWLGRRTMDRGGTWTATEALVGPMTASGLAFAYYDSTGAATATLTDVATLAITIRGRSAERARISAGTVDYVRDSIITRATLRNNRRF